MHLERIGLVFALTSFSYSAASAATFVPDPHSVATVAIVPQAADARRIVDSVNAERVSHLVAPLRVDGRLAALALAHALDMARNAYFSHDSLDDVTPFDRLEQARYVYHWAGENLALDSGPESAIEALWNSAEHRENTLEPHFARVGVGAVETPSGEIVVEDFTD